MLDRCDFAIGAAFVTEGCRLPPKQLCNIYVIRP